MTDDTPELSDFTSDVHDIVFEYQAAGLDIGEMADILSRMGDSYDRLERTIEVMADPEVQAALDDDDAQRALDIALTKALSDDE